MSDEPEPAAWTAALQQFGDAYGSEPDLSDPTDAVLFIPILRAEIEQQSRELVAAFRAATARFLQAGKRP